MKTSEAFLTRNDVVFDNKPFLLGFNNGVLDSKKLCEKEDGKFIYHYVHTLSLQV